MVTSLLLSVAIAANVKTFSFAGQNYLHRFSKGDMHEFTPKDQPNLQKWQDMLTVNNYPHVKDGEALASAASAVLENFKRAGAVVVRTNSVPRSKTSEAEHFIAVVFNRSGFSEAAFARFRIQGLLGGSLVYSHRVYGNDASTSMSKWMAANGPGREKALMVLKAWPAK